MSLSWAAVFSGLVAANELVDAGLRVLLVEQEPEQSLGGQAFWSLGADYSWSTRRCSVGWGSKTAKSWP